MTNEQKLRLSDYLNHILQSIEEIATYTADLEFVDFQKDKKTQRAVLMCFIIIGEASTKITQKYPNFVENNPEVAWQSMKGMRNQLAHGYFAVNLKVVWNTIEQELPKLKIQITKIIP